MTEKTQCVLITQCIRCGDITHGQCDLGMFKRGKLIKRIKCDKEKCIGYPSATFKVLDVIECPKLRCEKCKKVIHVIIDTFVQNKTTYKILCIDCFSKYH